MEPIKEDDSVFACSNCLGNLIKKINIKCSKSLDFFKIRRDQGEIKYVACIVLPEILMDIIALKTGEYFDHEGNEYSNFIKINWSNFKISQF